MIIPKGKSSLIPLPIPYYIPANKPFILLNTSSNPLTSCHSREWMLRFFLNSSNNVSMELVYVGWDFGDCHCDNSRVILDYNLS